MIRSLKHKFKLIPISIRLISGDSQLLRRFSTATSSFSPKNRSQQNLYKRLSVVGDTGENISDVLRSLINNGQRFSNYDLIHCVKSLRRYGRYHHCLEILQWMENGKFTKSTAEYCALYLNIICKVKGIDEAEKFFDDIPPEAKNHSVYGALLSCYCSEKMTDKAVTLFKKMYELNYASNVLAFNNIMSLFMKVGSPEKVFSLVEEMKQKNIPLNNHSYYIWIQSYRLLHDLKGLEQLLVEIQEKHFLREDWQIYTNLATTYIEAGLFEKADAALKKVEEILDKSKTVDRNAYHYLITLYANAGNLESVNLAWRKLKSKFNVYQNTCFLKMLRALSNLNDIEGLTNCFKEWESSHRIYDGRLPAVVIAAYLKHDMFEEAQQLLKDVGKKDPQNIKIAHVSFMNHFIERGQFDSALKHFDAAMAAKWKPFVEKLHPFFAHFIEEKDVDRAEQFCRELEKVQLLDSRAYLWLLQTYAAADKSAPGMRKRMEDNSITINTEHEELLRKIC